jgi:hypothetical protein
VLSIGSAAESGFKRIVANESVTRKGYRYDGRSTIEKKEASGL